MKIKKILTLLVVFTIFVILFYITDWGFVNEGITAYPISCPHGNYINNGCYIDTNNHIMDNRFPIAFFPNKESQIVITKNPLGPLGKLNDCIVVDRTSWQCWLYNKEVGIRSFDGELNFMTSFTNTTDEERKIISVTRFVPRWRWLLLGIFKK